MHELLAHGFAEVAQEALYDGGPFVLEPDGTTDGSPAAGDVELHDDRCQAPLNRACGCSMPRHICVVFAQLRGGVLHCSPTVMRGCEAMSQACVQCFARRFTPLNPITG